MNNQLSNEQKLKIIHDYCEEHPELRAEIEEEFELEFAIKPGDIGLAQKLFFELVDDMYKSYKKV